MREDQIVAQVITELDAATASDVDVRTIGSDQDINPPEIIVDWRPTKLENYNGHNSFGAYVTNNSGENIGVEHHVYFNMEVDCIARSYDELERDQLLHTVQSAFLPYERFPTSFDADTAEWSIGSGSPRENPVFEPDWFESGVLLSFNYLKRVEDTSTETADPIRDITKNVTVDESIDETTD